MPAPAGFTTTTVSGVPVVATPPELDISNAGELRAALMAAVAEGHATVVLDLSGTSFCDSAALQVLVRVHKRAVAEGGELRLVMRAVSLLRLFRITGVDRVIPNFERLDDALSQLPAISIRPQRPSLPAEAHIQGFPPR
ncbi:MAG TPA: STAS domain-containing protein [Streptosporangiaceae bacterium]|jgi:anti-sigma B factor antagonist|nr:STAS domain-containing protein [Streptosporangiaceae bacterium]